jgi:hypothetical protein
MSNPEDEKHTRELAAASDPNGRWSVFLHIASGIEFVLNVEQSRELVERLRIIVKDENISDWAPWWGSGSYAGIEIRCDNPGTDIPFKLRRGLGQVKLLLYDNYLTVTGFLKSVNYKDPTGLEDFLVAVGQTHEPPTVVDGLLTFVHEVINWRKDPDAKR